MVQAVFFGLSGVIALVAANSGIDEDGHGNLYNRALSIAGTLIICASMLVCLVGLAGGYKP
jgi:hypothetical protein